MSLSRLHITNTEDETGLRYSAEESKDEILNNLDLNTPNWLISKIKNYLVNFLKNK